MCNQILVPNFGNFYYLKGWGSRIYMPPKLFWGPEIAITGKNPEIVFHRTRNYFT